MLKLKVNLHKSEMAPVEEEVGVDILVCLLDASLGAALPHIFFLLFAAIHIPKLCEK